MNEVANLAEEIVAAFEEPFRIGEHELFLSASVGISLFPADGH
jgi:GGDEF domain-containing protein